MLIEDSSMSSLDIVETGRANRSLINQSLDLEKGSSNSRRIICRYGRGCTHILDAVHKERFWHPPIQQLTSEQIRTHYICYECGDAFLSLNDLQVCIIINSRVINYTNFTFTYQFCRLIYSERPHGRINP
jgi:hypothetical protein